MRKVSHDQNSNTDLSYSRRARLSIHHRCNSEQNEKSITRPGTLTQIYHTQDEHAYQYTIDVIQNRMRKVSHDQDSNTDLSYSRRACLSIHHRCNSEQNEKSITRPGL